MAQSNDDISMALFCDFENIALGVRDAQYEKFDIKPILERLLLKGSIVVKKAYCDWERYKSFKAAMHEANFELIEIPHVRQSGKNSADIRMVVDALDLCYTKAHVNTFVIISGDSDFSPLVSKLRENAKRVIGVGVKQSTSDLLIANCDEFIYIDDLMRKRNRDDKQSRKSAEPVDPQELESRRVKGLEMAVTTLEAMLEDRSDDEKVWASVLKEAIKRRHPGFNENYHGYRTLGAMLEDAHKRGLLEFGRENNSAYVKRRAPGNTLPTAEPELLAPAMPAEESTVPPVPEIGDRPQFSEDKNRGLSPISSAPVEPPAPAKRRSRGGRKPKPAEPAVVPVAETVPATEAPPVAEAAAEAAPVKKPARKPRSPRRKKTEVKAEA